MKYNSELGKKAIELGRIGCTESNIAAELGIGSITMKEWSKKYPDFQLAMDIALTASKSFHETKLREAYTNKDANASLIMGLLKANWPDDYIGSTTGSKAKNSSAEPADPDQFNKAVADLIKALRSA